MDLEDDWLFDSIKKYRKLYMYNLQNPVIAADWLTANSLIVSTSSKGRHEILELSLPAQLCVEEENTGLTKSRDFQILTGSFADNCLTSLHNLPKTRKVVACIKGDNSVETWQLQTGDKNLIEKLDTISNKTPTCVSSQLCILNNSQLVFGSHLDNICVADLATHTVISHTCDQSHGQTAEGSGVDGKNCPVSNLIQHDSYVLTSDTTSGMLFLIDPRLDVVKPEHVSARCAGGVVSDTWTLCDGVPSTEHDVIQMSSSGSVCVRDCRNLKQCVKTMRTQHETQETGNIRLSSCPSDPDMLAVTGVDGCVHLYDKRTWEDGGVIKPVFVHEGHMVERDDPSLDIRTNVHLWYPWKQQTLLSASEDGGLHIFLPVL